ncbi:MAG TPA: S41 family peptidase [Ignavibacteriaceae bacterium]|nr:S41 family peptidase [Ignavibacteriaceae bacterium]
MKVITINKKIIFILFLILTATQFNFGQVAKTQVSDRKILLKIKNADRSEFKYIPKKPGHYTIRDWKAVIDSTWGEGLPTEKKLQIFDRFWNDIDAYYPSFFNINVNWDSLKSVYRPEIEAGVSRGRFAAIMNRMSSALTDKHTFILDNPVSTDSLKLGTPLLITSGYESMAEREFLSEEYCHFGASLSLLPDSSLLVYDVVPDHPLGLESGDVVLGYDGILWKKLYKELLAAELPFRFEGTIGSNAKSIIHLLLTSAGENWHLFDTIDVVKYNNGDTIHSPTTLLQGKKMKLLSTTQLPIAGVPFPDIGHGHWVSWGVINGTNIGYIYVWNWTSNGDFPYPTTPTGTDFRNAIETLINDYEINGLIIDSRYNTGGQFSEFAQGMRILFNQDQDIFKGYSRDKADDHYSMKVYNGPTGGITQVNTTRYLFDRPIAVLISPYSISCGDFMPLQMRYHPMVRTFGYGTNGAFGTVNEINIDGISTDWLYHRTVSNFKLKDKPEKYLTHLSIPPDEEVWFTKESVAKGEDDVVNASLNWMNNLVYGHDIMLSSISLKPAIDTLKISALVENPNSHQTSSKVYIKNISGSFIDSLALSKVGLSDNSEIWSGNYVAPDSEDFFSLSLSAKDITDSKTWTTPNISRFTTAGPVTVDSVTFTSFSNSYYFLPFVHNWGKTTTIKNAAIRFIIKDPWVKSYNSNGIYGLSLPDIVPGSTIGASSKCIASIVASLFPGYFNIKFEIMKDGWVYWTDSIKTIVTGINGKNIKPLTFKLEQNYPNPFNPSTKIKYTIPSSVVTGHASSVQLKVYDVLGREVTTLVNETKLPGKYEIEFNAASLSSGVYFYRITAGNYTAVKKMLLMK